MFYRKISNLIEEHLQSNSEKILLIDGARQVGKSFIIREVGKKLFKNYVEINLIEDAAREKYFENVASTEDFYFALNMKYSSNLGNKKDTLIFLDEIQQYPDLLTLLKFLKQDNKYTYIASGSMLGITLSATSSIPMGSIRKVRMYPMDFEEFLLANGFNSEAIETLRKKFTARETLPENFHNRLLDLFRKFLISGGLPDAVTAFTINYNIPGSREVQLETHEYYAADASKYDLEKKLKIRSIYDLIPSNMENKKKRIIVKEIENKRGKTFNDYQEEFEYLVSSGITLQVQAISDPHFPLLQTAGKNLLKLYLNDVGILTALLYGNNVKAILEDVKSINLGSVYETVVASELRAHGHVLYYYDNKSKGEVDFLIDDYDNLSALPIEVKSGRDFAIHRAIDALCTSSDIKQGIVLSNNREIKIVGKLLYLPIYFVMFL